MDHWWKSLSFSKVTVFLYIIWNLYLLRIIPTYKIKVTHKKNTWVRDFWVHPSNKLRSSDTIDSIKQVSSTEIVINGL